MYFDVRCKKCDLEFSAPTKATKFCHECGKAHAAELRAVYERAYFAALTGFCAAQPIPGVIDFDPAHNAKWVALETVRQWPAMMAELNALIGEMG